MNDNVWEARIKPGEVAVCEGAESGVVIFGPSFRAENASALPPIQKATLVARLRALADEIERTN